MSASASSTANPAVLGTWRLLSFTAEEDGRVVRPLGETCRGQLIYTEEGCVSAQLAGTEGYIGYAGRFEWRDDQVVHRTTLASSPQWQEKELTRAARLDGDMLELRAAPQHGQPCLVLLWRRESAQKQ
ncbi:lipocalin-like domain-containing protein [Amycolatopsis rubida]|uniref:Lipocalin-like domain-containing protein n=1 Tax=Amycolatopsis rubida TaxID=112413 RepID=A0A1I5VJT6_9PSEU|nr:MULTISPECIES: lipocalin-like domain-containing protein [Amycolatopsis]MYW93792.1 hypothetical protein [Amycolatopsis rubida]NEC58782.1 lipocalin-like domain-containing protein [Amycolatopsis rubida]OAP22981.1 hypothetical protein A4R44_06443 [Amycolatopsis sp. M39]SFQ07729.1 Lipocalin-like domain-containing protein [Amycolatopsis rubida]